MTSDDIKSQIQSAYSKAMGQPNFFRQRISQLSALFLHIRLYGRDSGIDFAQSHIHEIIADAIQAAECKNSHIEINCHGWGRAAIDGLASALQNETGLTVDINNTTLKLSWADPTPRLL